MIRLLDKYGFDTVYGCINEIYDHAERMAREAIRNMPAGTWTGIDYCDDNGIDRGVPLKVGVAVTIDPAAAEITFDYSQSAEQQRGPMNVPVITAISISRMLGKILTAPGLRRMRRLIPPDQDRGAEGIGLQPARRRADQSLWLARNDSNRSNDVGDGARFP